MGGLFEKLFVTSSCPPGDNFVSLCQLRVYVQVLSSAGGAEDTCGSHSPSGRRESPYHETQSHRQLSSMTRKAWVQNHVLRKGCGTMVKLGGRQSWAVGKLAGDFKDLDRAGGGGPYL